MVYKPHVRESIEYHKNITDSPTGLPIGLDLLFHAKMGLVMSVSRVYNGRNCTCFLFFGKGPI